jgi:[ribosomal protein S18]-alanine N-acetyltransferase
MGGWPRRPQTVRTQEAGYHVNIRCATSADIPAMIALEKHVATAAHWSREQYEKLFASAGQEPMALVLAAEGILQGFLIARGLGGEWEIENIAVAGAARRNGLGTRLLGEFLDLIRGQGAESVFLEVRESNRAARGLYEKWAFLESGRRKSYYHDPEEDAILYRLAFV